MDDALFLKAARAHIEQSKRLHLFAYLTAPDALRLLEMAERWHAETAKPVQADDLRGLAGRR